MRIVIALAALPSLIVIALAALPSLAHVRVYIYIYIYVYFFVRNWLGPSLPSC